MRKFNQTKKGKEVLESNVNMSKKAKKKLIK